MRFVYSLSKYTTFLVEINLQPRKQRDLGLADFDSYTGWRFRCVLCHLCTWKRHIVSNNFECQELYFLFSREKITFRIPYQFYKCLLALIAWLLSMWESCILQSPLEGLSLPLFAFAYNSLLISQNLISRFWLILVPQLDWNVTKGPKGRMLLILEISRLT
jgi:hypothetical protein